MYNEKEQIAIILISSPILFLNIAEIWIILKKKKILSNYERILLSLAIADALVSVAVVSGHSYELAILQSGSFKKDKDWTKEKTYVEFGVWFSILASMMHVLGLTVDRFIAIQYPFRHKIWITKTRMQIFLAVTWFVSLTSISLLMFLLNLLTLKLVASYFAMSFSIVIAVAYILIVKKVLVDQNKTLGGVASLNTASQQREQQKKKEHRLVITCLIIVLAFLISVVPFSLYMMVGKKEVVYVCILLICNSMANPLIFFYTHWRDKQIRPRTNKVYNFR